LVNPRFGGLSKPWRRNIIVPNTLREDSVVALSHVFAGVGGYYASKDKKGLAGVFRRASDGGEWQHALSDIEAYTVFVHPRDPNLVFAGTADGVYRSTDGGVTFKRANFPGSGVQIWSFLRDPADPRHMLAGGSPVSIYRSNDAGETWTRLADPKLPDRGKAPFADFKPDTQKIAQYERKVLAQRYAALLHSIADSASGKKPEEPATLSMEGSAKHA